MRRSLIDFDSDGQRLLTGAVAGAAYRRGAKSIQPDSDADISIGRAYAIHRIEADPAETGHVGLGPGMTAFVSAAVVGAQVSRDITGRDLQAARGAEEDVGQIAGGATLARKCFRRGRRRS